MSVRESNILESYLSTRHPSAGSCYREPVEILLAEYLDDPGNGFGLQQAVLEEVASGDRGPTALIWTSAPYVGATRRETRFPGFNDAVRAVEDLGFPVLVRNSGGGAVAANEGSISFSVTYPVGEMGQNLYERYTDGVDLVAAALRRVGVEAEGGEVEGEFCPGAYSVRSGGALGVKHAGLAQRVTRGAARLEALILVSDTQNLIPVLERFHGALGLPFRAGSIKDIEASVTQVIEALSEEVLARYEAIEGFIETSTWSRARRRSEWRLTAG